MGPRPCLRPRRSIDAPLEESRQIVPPIVKPRVAHLSAIEKGFDVGDVVLVVAGVKQEPFLGLQQGRPPQPVDMALSDHDQPLGHVFDPSGAPEFDERVELLSAIGAIQPVVRHDNDQDLCLPEAVVDQALELIAVADAFAVTPDLGLCRA